MIESPIHQQPCWKQLRKLDEWLSKVYLSDTQLTDLLSGGGMSQADIMRIKQDHLVTYLDAIMTYLRNVPADPAEVSCNEVMLRHFGLLTGQGETLQSIGNEMHLGRERVRQLAHKRVHFYQRRRGKLAEAFIMLAYTILDYKRSVATSPATGVAFLLSNSLNQIGCSKTDSS